MMEKHITKKGHEVEIRNMQTETRGVCCCPSCGFRAKTRIIQSYDFDGNIQSSRFLMINCEICGYYVFESMENNQ